MSELLATRDKVGFDPRTQSLTAVRAPSAAAGEIGKIMIEQLRRLAEEYSPTLREAGIVREAPASIEEGLHNALAAAKILLSQVSMHLSKVWRDKLFQQLDTLLDVDSWDEADKMLESGSFSTFLRMIIYLRLERRPALGISHRGHLLADWTVNGESLTIEFLPKDEVRWVLAHHVDGERETAAGQTHLGRLEQVLAPYAPRHWFADANES